MNRTIQTYAGALLAVVAALVVGVIGPGGEVPSTHAQTTESETSEPAKSDGSTSPPETTETVGPEEGDESNPPAGDGPSEASDAPPEEELSAADRLAQISKNVGLPAVEPTALADLTSLRDDLSRRAKALGEQVKQLRSLEDELETGRKSLSSQLNNPALPKAALPPLRQGVVLSEARQRVIAARRSGLEQLRGNLRDHGAFVDAQIKQLERKREEESKQDNEERQQVERAEQAEQNALAELEKARRQERQERDKEIRKLISERSDYLSKIADVAREQGDQIKQLGARRGGLNETFARRQEEIESTLETLPEEPAEKRRRDEVDPLFSNIRGYRKEARRDYSTALEDLRAAMAEVDKAERGVSEAKADLQDVRERSERLGDSDLVEQKVSVAEARLKYQRRLLERANDVATAHEKSLELHADRIDYYNTTVEKILPKISRQAQRDYFSIWDNENWRNVGASFEEGTRYMSRIVKLRFEQLKSLPDRVYSAELWGWVLGFLWRMLLIPLAVYMLRNYSSWAINRAMEAALKRRFFRKRATGTIKVGELLRSIIWPVTIILTIQVVAGYVTKTFTELQSVIWMIDVWFIYWILMTIVKVMILPRAFRETQGRTTPSPDLGRLSDRTHVIGEDVVDIITMEVGEARKLVRTVRHILVFALASWLVPQIAAKIVGHTVLWALIESAFDWAVIAIVYYELSNWRDEVARLFRALAGERIPRVADFVDKHKDTIYGVLIIGLASLYVLFVELGKFSKRYFLETELSQRLGNFIFRKKIELKQRERENAEEDENDRQGELPENYRQLFGDRPLYDEGYLVERPDAMNAIIEKWDRWLDRQRQGSIAVTGEQGIGKTTLLNQVYREFCRRQRVAADDDEPDERPPHLRTTDEYELLYTALIDKVTTVDALISYLADVFGLPEVPKNRDVLVERLLERPAKILMIDDCHHLFFRRIEGFEALEVFLDVVNLTDHHHFWMLTFNKYGWKYMQRVQERKHFFGTTVTVEPWTPDQLQELVDRRNEKVDLNVSFTDLVVTREEERDSYYEVVKTANGYFRLLQEYCQGNPRVAMDFWTRNLVPESDGTMQVSLFGRPSLDSISELTDNHLFALTAIVQHGSLSAREIAEIINAEAGFCEMALNYFEEVDIARRIHGTGRYQLTPFYFRPVVSRLTNSNFLWS